MWRWTGFNSGLDLIVTYDSFRLTLKRNIATDHEALTSTHKKRHVSYRYIILIRITLLYMHLLRVTEKSLLDLIPLFIFSRNHFREEVFCCQKNTTGSKKSSSI